MQSELNSTEPSCLASSRASVRLAGIEFSTGKYQLILFLACIVAVSLVSIWRNIGTGFWLDETFTGAVSCTDSFAATLALIRHDVHPVLYHLLTHALFKVAGCHLWLVRGLSVVASLTAAYILIRQVGRSGGNVFVATALTLGTFSFWQYAFEARAYSLLFLAGSCVIAFSISDRKNAPFAAVASALIGGLLHYYASFLFAVLFLVVVVCRKPIVRSPTFWACFIAAGLVLCVYYALQIEDAMRVGSALVWIKHPHMNELLHYFPATLFGSIASSLIVLIVLINTSVALFSSNPFMVQRQAVLLTAIFFSFVFLLFGASYFKPMFVYRYAHFLVPALIVGLAMLSGDADKALLSVDRRKASEFSSLTIILLIAYAGANLVHLRIIDTRLRDMGWQDAQASMTCTIAQPCGFFIDDPVLPNMLVSQYTALANFLAPVRGSFIALQPHEMVPWIKAHPGGQLLYVASSQTRIDFKKVIAEVPLKCRDFRSNLMIGAEACQSLAATAK